MNEIRRIGGAAVTASAARWTGAPHGDEPLYLPYDAAEHLENQLNEAFLNGVSSDSCERLASWIRKAPTTDPEADDEYIGMRFRDWNFCGDKYHYRWIKSLKRGRPAVLWIHNFDGLRTSFDAITELRNRCIGDVILLYILRAEKAIQLLISGALTSDLLVQGHLEALSMPKV